MSEKELNKIIASNITKLLSEHGKSQLDLAEFIGVSQATVSNWCRGEKMPRMKKIDLICDFFHCKRSDLMEEKTNKEPSYYLNDETKEIAQEIYENPDLRILFDASKNATPEDLQFIIEMVNRMKGNN